MLIITLMLWVCVHRILVHMYFMNPWKLNGFAMYVNTHNIAIGIVDASSQERMIAPQELNEQELFALKRTITMTEVLGKLYYPDFLATTLLTERPHITQLKMRILIRSLRPFTGTEVTNELAYHYDRSFLQ